MNSSSYGDGYRSNPPYFYFILFLCETYPAILPKKFLLTWKMFHLEPTPISLKVTRIKVCRTIISPSFSYCPTILYFGTLQNIDKMQLLQNRCLRIILKRDRYTPISNMLECLGLMNVKHFLFLQTMCFVYKLYKSN